MSFDFTYGAITLFGGPFQWPLVIVASLAASFAEKARLSSQPHECNGCNLLHTRGLDSSPFARRYLENLYIDLYSSGY